MSQKAMVFIDGCWLYRCRTALFQKLGEENGFEIDYARLPRVFCEDVADFLDEDISLVRTHYFSTIPSSRSGFNTAKQYSFYDFLERECRYETSIQEIDVSSGDARNDAAFTRVALVSSLLFCAAQPGAFDIAIVLGDDLELTPALRAVRLMGKRVQLVGLHAPDGAHAEPTASDRPRTSDFPTLFLDDHAADVRLVREVKRRVCKACGREEETTWAGSEFFCSACRGHHRSD